MGHKTTEEFNEQYKKGIGSPILRFFEYGHLKGRLREVSQDLCVLAEIIEKDLPSGPEKSAGLRKLLEAKDCFVRAALPPKEEPKPEPKEESDVFSRPECMFNYCDNPNICKKDNWCHHVEKKS